MGRVSIKKKRTPLTTANVVVTANPGAASTSSSSSRQRPSQQSVKVSNLPPSYESVVNEVGERLSYLVFSFILSVNITCGGRGSWEIRVVGRSSANG